MKRFNILLLSILMIIFLAIPSVDLSSTEEFINVPVDTVDPAGEFIDVPVDIVDPAEEFIDVPIDTVDPAEEFIDASTETINDATHILAEVKVSAGLYNCTDISEAAAIIPAGTRVQVEETTDPFWYLVTLDGTAQKQWGVTGAVWYIYAENLCRVVDNKAVDTTIYEEYITESFNEWKEIFPHGKYWNHIGFEISVNESSPYYVTDTPCTHFVSASNAYDYSCKYCNRYLSAASQFMGMQCVGFASLLGDEIFGENAPVHSYSDLDQLRVGDYIRYSHSIGYYNGYHTITVTGIYDTYITVVEVNRDFEACKIEWERKIDHTELENKWDIICYTRYPLKYTGTGYIPW